MHGNGGQHLFSRQPFRSCHVVILGLWSPVFVYEGVLHAAGLMKIPWQTFEVTGA